MSLSLPASLFLRAISNTVLAWGMVLYLPEYIAIGGGMGGYVLIGCVLTILNIFIRPLLNLVTWPLKLVTTLVALIVVNAGFLWITNEVVKRLDPTLVTLDIKGGLQGWMIVAIVIGVANWMMKLLLR